MAGWLTNFVNTTLRMLVPARKAIHKKRPENSRKWALNHKKFCGIIYTYSLSVKSIDETYRS